MNECSGVRSDLYSVIIVLVRVGIVCHFRGEKRNIRFDTRFRIGIVLKREFDNAFVLVKLRGERTFNTDFIFRVSSDPEHGKAFDEVSSSREHCIDYLCRCWFHRMVGKGIRETHVS